MNLAILLGSAAAVVLPTVGSLGAALIFRRVVPTEFVHIVQSAKKTVSFGKGKEAGNVYYAWPSSLPVIGVTITQLPISNFAISLNAYEAFDKGRLPFLVDVSAFFRIVDSDVAASRVSSFDDLKSQLKQILSGAVRSVLASESLEHIMQDRTTLGQKFTQSVDEQLKQWGVASVNSIEFLNMQDAPNQQVIHNIMEKDKSRIEMESRVTVAENKRAAQEREIEASRQVDLQKQDAAQQVGKRTAESEKAVGIAKEQSRQEVLEQSKMTMEREMAVKLVAEVKAAEIAKEVADVKAAQDKSVAITRADQDKSVALTKADQDKQVAVKSAEAVQERAQIEAAGEKAKTTLVSEGQLAAAQNDAKGIEARGEAEGRAREAILLAEVAPQITLAKEIGENPGYQTYLIETRKVDAVRDVGIKQAEALAVADIKVIANGGSVSEGVSSIGDIFSSKGGTSLAAAAAGLASTAEGAAILSAVTGAVAKVKAPKGSK